MKSTLAGRVVLATLLMVPRPLAPAIIIVDGSCTLVDAITAANTDAATGSCPSGDVGADILSLTQDVTLTAIDNTTSGANGLPSIASDVTVQGNGHLIARSAGAPPFRIFHLTAGGSLALDTTTVSNGVADGVLKGGGVYSYGGTLLLTNSTLSDNLSVLGGGIYNSGGGTVTLTDTTLSGNTAGFGGGVYNSGDGTLNVTNSTLSRNAAGFGGGGLFSFVGTTTTLTNSTLARNSAGFGGGLYAGSAATLTNSLIGQSLSGSNCAGLVTDNGGNLADDTTCGSIPSNLTGLNPSLSDNGGPTMTHALLDGSNAIDVGSAPACPPNDQRGAARVNACDIGSYEFIPCPDLALSDDTVMGIVTEENCQRILVGPNFAVAGGGNLTLRAGKRVSLGNGTSVAMDGQLRIAIDPDLQLVPPPP
ncbi:MAG: hypothetical protein GY769_13120 [bacterium]|nr:hypothetical protein [bacterium]